MDSVYWFLDQVGRFWRLPLVFRTDYTLLPRTCLLLQTHIVVTGITGISFLYTRSAHVGYFIVGGLACNTFGTLRTGGH